MIELAHTNMQRRLAAHYHVHTYMFIIYAGALHLSEQRRLVYHAYVLAQAYYDEASGENHSVVILGCGHIIAVNTRPWYIKPH